MMPMPGPGPCSLQKIRTSRQVELLTFSGGVNPTAVNDKVLSRDGIG